MQTVHHLELKKKIKENPYSPLKRIVWCCCMLVYSLNIWLVYSPSSV